jgi:hypothetical protein
MTARAFFKRTALILPAACLSLGLSSCSDSVESGSLASDQVEWKRKWGTGASGAYSTIHFSRRINNTLIPGPSIGGSNLSVEFKAKTATTPAYAVVSNGRATAEIEILPLSLTALGTSGLRVVKTGDLIVE